MLTSKEEGDEMQLIGNIASILSYRKHFPNTVTSVKKNLKLRWRNVVYMKRHDAVSVVKK